MIGRRLRGGLRRSKIGRRMYITESPPDPGIPLVRYVGYPVEEPLYSGPQYMAPLVDNIDDEEPFYAYLGIGVSFEEVFEFFMPVSASVTSAAVSFEAVEGAEYEARIRCVQRRGGVVIFSTSYGSTFSGNSQVDQIFDLSGADWQVGDYFSISIEVRDVNDTFFAPILAGEYFIATLAVSPLP